MFAFIFIIQLHSRVQKTIQRYGQNTQRVLLVMKEFSLLLEMQEIQLRGSLKRCFSKAPGKLFFLTQRVSRKIPVNVFMRFS